MFAIALLLTTRAALPSYDEIQRGMYATYRGLSHFEDDWQFTLQKGSDPTVRQSFSRKIDKERSAFTASVEGRLIFRQTHDGSTFGIMIATSKVFAKSTTPNQEFVQSYDKAIQKIEENSFDYFVKAYDICFLSNPPFVVTSLEPAEVGGVKTREITAIAKRADGSATLTLHSWFDTDRWILRKIEVEGVSKVTGTFSIRGELQKIDFDAKIPAAEFLLRPEELQGFQEVPLSQLKAGG